MGNDNLLLSMMVGACVFLLLGIGVTVVEVLGYTGEVEVPTATAPAGDTGQAQSQTDAGGQQAGGMGGMGTTSAKPGQLLAQAPQDVMGVATVNVARLRSAGFVEQGGMANQMVQSSSPISGADLEQFLVMGLPPAQGSGAPPAMGMVIKHKASPADVTNALNQQGSAGEPVQGMDTYKLQQQQGMMVAIADDTTVLGSNTSAGLNRVISLYKQEGALGQLLQQQGSAIKFDVRITDEMRTQMQQQGDQAMPAWAKTIADGLNRVSGELDMSGQGISFSTLLAMSGEQGASQVADEFNTKLTQAKDQITQVLQQQIQGMQSMGGSGQQAQQKMQTLQDALDMIPTVFNKINIAAQATDVSVSAQFTKDEFDSMKEMATSLIQQIMMQRMQQSFGGGGQGGMGGGFGMPGGSN